MEKNTLKLRCHHRKGYNSKTIMCACIDNSCYDSDWTQVVNRFLNNYVYFSRPSFPGLVTCSPLTHQEKNTSASVDAVEYRDDVTWLKAREEAQRDMEQEPIFFQFGREEIGREELQDMLEEKSQMGKDVALGYGLIVKMGDFFWAKDDSRWIRYDNVSNAQPGQEMGD
ncbi:uncharacterized protein LOC122093440 [Macadamia integrifolia]|uniref:uncharacterized protein LOC122093440 n=1 Tax=Macadamia integrifolia TaxID=60698 RepID=UPI001C4E68AA|nr:uncharacterized protein LOC122057530 isoform X2 [Macadamia integrifolia]XP_042519728.1 uncharacterized protein LOC122093440 [Macadamia integrifolia]